MSEMSESPVVASACCVDDECDGCRFCFDRIRRGNLDRRIRRAVEIARRLEVLPSLLGPWRQASGSTRAIELAHAVDVLELLHVDVDRMRNYELEQNLHEFFGGKWVVIGMCPFNGVHCAGAKPLPVGTEVVPVGVMPWAKAEAADG